MEWTTWKKTWKLFLKQQKFQILKNLFKNSSNSTHLNHILVTIIIFFPMERTEDDNFKKCWFLAASVYNYNSWGGLLYEVLTQIRKCDLCEKGETKYVCMYVSRSRTYHRRCISKREEMIWKKFREKNVWTLPDENYEDDGAGQQV